MQYDVSMTPAQLAALYEWAALNDDNDALDPEAIEQNDGAPFADILIVREGDNLVVGQADARVRISPAGDTVDHPEPYTGGDQAAAPEPLGNRIAREGRAMLDAARDVDYDPAAEDEDGVPIFSEETREEAARRLEAAGHAGEAFQLRHERPTDDPRYQTGAH